MSQTKSFHIIGGGFGGIAAALRMRAKGYDVTLIERGNELGGRARVFKQDGHIFDAGPTVITAPYLINELFALFNKNPHDYLNILPLEHWYRYQFDDGSHFDYVGNQQKMLENIRDFSPEDVLGFKKLQALSEKIFDKGFTELSDQPFFSLTSMLKHAPALLRIGFYRSVYKAVGRYIKNEKLRRVFTTQPLLVGGDPFKTTSIYLLILHLEQKYGCHYSLGGTHGIIRGLEKLMREVGIHIRYQTTLTKINASANNHVSSLTVNGNEDIPCQAVIYNGDPGYAYEHLIDGKHQTWLNRLRLKHMKYSMSLCLYYFGTDKIYNDVKLHTISYGRAYKELLADLFHRQVLNPDLSLYLYRPTAVDKTLAPEGCDSFYVLAPVPNLKSGINWQEMQVSFKEHIIDLLEKRLLPNLRQHIRTELFLTPDYFEQELLSMHGAGFSIQPIFTQSAYLRFHNRSKKLKGLYFVGAGTHPGAGVPGVLSSARLVDKLIEPAYVE